jgi:hypothetical protein
MREEPPQPPTQPKPVAPTTTPYGGQNTGEYYRQYYESLRKQAEARQRAEMAAAQRAQAEYIRQQQIQMREQPQPQQYGVQQGAPVIRDTMPNMTQIAPPVVRDTMPRMPQTTQYAPVIRDTVPTTLEGRTYFDYSVPGMFQNMLPNRTELPYYDQPMTRAFAQWLGNVYPETYDYGLGFESPDVFSNYGPSEWIKPEGPPAPTRHGPITNPRTIQAMQDIMNVDFTYNPAIDPSTLPGGGYTGGYSPYNYIPYRYGGYSYPKYDYKYPEPVKSWYESMLQWNI